MSTKDHTIMLKEQCADSPERQIEVRLLYASGQLWIQPEGYGDKCSADGHGTPVGLEIWQGRLRLILFDDINEEAARFIDLEKARETTRQEEVDTDS
ncbi:MAG: hypothetical protein GY869_00275 [Planctomycetes bacterium]|nr:hypothetical protein [Planctomycetota bacterium]